MFSVTLNEVDEPRSRCRKLLDILRFNDGMETGEILVNFKGWAGS